MNSLQEQNYTNIKNIDNINNFKKVNIKINRNVDLIPLNKNYKIGNDYIYGDNDYKLIKLDKIEVNNKNFIKKCIDNKGFSFNPTKKNFFPFYYSPFSVLYESKMGMEVMKYYNFYPFYGYYMGFGLCTNSIINNNSKIVEASIWNKQEINKKIFLDMLGFENKCKNSYLSIKVYKDGNNLEIFMDKVKSYLENKEKKVNKAYAYYKVRKFVRNKLNEHKVKKSIINNKMESDSDSSNSDLEYYEKPEMRRYFYYHSRMNAMGQVNGWSKMDDEFEEKLKDELQTSIDIKTKRRKNCISRLCNKKTNNEYGVCKKCYDFYIKNILKESLSTMQNIIKRHKNHIVRKDIEKNLAICVNCNYNLDFVDYNILSNIRKNDECVIVEKNEYETFRADWVCPQKNGGCGYKNISSELINKNDYNTIINMLEDKKNKKINENIKKYNETTYTLVRNYILENMNN